MIEIKIDDETYTERQYKRDITRMFDTYRHDSDHMGKSSCNGVDCRECPLGDNSQINSQIAVCKATKAKAFDLIEFVQKWAHEHPVFTNKDMLKKTFGKDVIHYIEARPYKEEWLDEEYKKPKGEKEKG
jgi:hypothetical protein